MDNKLFDIVCTLPLTSDLITLASHPFEPLFVVGLASGHIQAFRLPTPSSTHHASSTNLSNGESFSPPRKRPGNATAQVTFSDEIISTPHKASEQRSKPRRSSLLRSSSSPSPTSGCGMIETVWKTRRHKGSCRALVFSSDGKTLFSAGTDGIIKAADSATGHVIGKALVPGNHIRRRKSKSAVHPSRLLALSPRCLVLGDDEGGIHEYELHEVSLNSVKGSKTPNGQVDDEVRLSPRNPQPSKTHHPHRTEDNPEATEPITSLTALPPSNSSTSGASRSWISTAGCTLAVCDVYKGVMSCSVEQTGAGENWELLSSAYVLRSKLSANHTADSHKKKPAIGKSRDDLMTIVVGDSSGGCSFWSRGRWDNRTGYRRLRRNVAVEGMPLEDYGIDSIAVASANEQDPEPLIVAGLATGVLHFLRFGSGQRPMEAAVTHVHDDRGLDGCSAITFDAEGRMITGGGNVVKVWHREPQDAELEEAGSPVESAENLINGGSEMEDDSSDEGTSLNRPKKRPLNKSARDQPTDESEDVEGSESGSEDAAPPPKKRNKRAKKKQSGKGKKGVDDGRGDHGVMKFALD